MDFRWAAARAASSSRTPSGTPLMVIFTGMSASCVLELHATSTVWRALQGAGPGRSTYNETVLADTDMAHVFPAGHGRRGDGRRGDGYLGMREVAARIAAGEGFAAQPLTSTPPRIDSSEAVAGDFCGYEQFVPGFGDDAERDAWYRGMFAAPYHVDGSTQVFCAATDRIRRLLRRNEPGAEVLSPEAWAERFYPGEVP